MWCDSAPPLGTQYQLWWNGGSGSNTKAEAMALWGLLWFNLHKNISSLNIYGESMTLIDGIKGTTGFFPPFLLGWLRRIKHSLGFLLSYTISHVYRECNRMVDNLSKDALNRSSGLLHYRYLVEDKVLKEGTLRLPWIFWHPTTRLYGFCSYFGDIQFLEFAFSCIF